MATIKGITVQIGADTTGLDAALKDVNKTSREISKELREVERLLKFNPHDTEVLAQKQKLLADQVENAREKLNRLKEVQAQVNQQFQEGKISEEQYRAFQRELIKTESQLKEYEKQLRAVNLQNHEFNQKMQEAGKKLQDVGKQLTDVGKTLSTRLTAPLTALGAVSAKMAIDFESAFAGVRKTVEATEDEFAALAEGIREMAKEIPAAATEIAGVAEAAGQLGIANEHILSFTRTMIDLGESTNMSAEEAATALARLANITQMPQSEFDRLGSTIVALGNNLATTEAEIVEMSLRLAGAGKQVGMTEAEILSFAGALSSVGIAAEAGGSAFSKVMIQMQLAAETGGEKLEQFAAVAGMSAEQFATTFQENAAQALIAFINGLQRAQEEGTSAIKVLDDIGITEVRMRDALLRAAGAGDLFAESIKLGTEAWEENVALATEAEQRYKTTESQLAIMRNKLQEVAITFGQILLPPLLAVVEKIGDLADWLANLSPTTQRTIVVIGGLVAALGPALLLIGQMATGAGAVVQAFGKLSAFISKTLIPAITSISLPVVGVVAGIAGLAVIAYEVYRAWDEVKTALSATWEYMKASAEKLALNMSLSFEKMKVTIIGVVDEILERLSILEALPFGIGDSFAGLREKVSGSVDASRQKIEELQAALDANATKMKDAAEDMKVSWGDVGAKVAEDIQLVINKITGQTEVMAAELDEQTEIVETEWTAQTDFILQELDTQLQAITDIEQEKTEVITDEANKQAEARAKFEADWNRKLFQLTADRLAQLEAEEAEALARAEALEADKTAIIEYYTILRKQIEDKANEELLAQQEAINQKRQAFEQQWADKLFDLRASELDRLDKLEREALEQAEKYEADKTAIVEYFALRREEIREREAENERKRQEQAQQELERFENQWKERLFRATADELELLEYERDQAIALAEELGADRAAILEFYTLKEQEILRRRAQEAEEEAKRQKAELERQGEAVASFEERWTQKVFEQTASRIDRLRWEREQALAEAEKLGADKTAILEYYAAEERRIMDETEAERNRLAQQWRDRLFKATADELEILEAQMQAELEFAEQHQLDITDIVAYYEHKRKEIIDRRQAEADAEARKREEQAEAEARKIAQQAEQLAEKRAQFEESWNRKLLELSGDRIAILEYEKEQALAQAEELGANRAAIEEYYNKVIAAVRDEEAQAEQKRQEALNEERATFEEEWNKKLLELSDDRLAILEYEKQQAVAKAEALGADTTAILEYYAQKQAELADKSKQGWIKAAEDIGKAFETMALSVGKMFVTGTGRWEEILLTFVSSAIDHILVAAVGAMGIAELVSKAIANMWNPVGWVVIGGLLAALAVIQSNLQAKLGKVGGAVPPGSGGGGAESGGTAPKPAGGRQVAEITGPTRDILTDLLSPLAHLAQIVGPDPGH